MYCRKCGAQLQDTANFCTKCGNVISPQPAPTAARQPARKKRYTVQPRDFPPTLMILTAAFTILCTVLTVVFFYKDAFIYIYQVKGYFRSEEKMQLLTVKDVFDNTPFSSMYYFVVIFLWLFALGTVCVAFMQIGKTFAGETGSVVFGKRLVFAWGFFAMTTFPLIGCLVLQNMILHLSEGTAYGVTVSAELHFSPYGIFAIWCSLMTAMGYHLTATMKKRQKKSEASQVQNQTYQPSVHYQTQLNTDEQEPAAPVYRIVQRNKKEESTDETDATVDHTSERTFAEHLQYALRYTTDSGMRGYLERIAGSCDPEDRQKLNTILAAQDVHLRYMVGCYLQSAQQANQSPAE